MDVKVLGSNAAVIKEHNRTLVLELILRTGPLSRSQIARETRLTKTAITDIANELLAIGLIKEVGAGDSTGGRRPIMLDVNSDAFRIIVADLSGPTIRLGVSSLRANITKVITRRLSPAAEFTVNDLLILLKEAIASESDDRRPILGIGLAVPGLLDYETGTVINAVQLGWNNIPLKERTAAYFGLPVFVEREINAALLGEQWFGDARLLDNIIYVTLGTGIGVSVMVKGALYHGHNRLAGEFGHTVIQSDGPLCKCGNRGCLESLASMTAIVEQVKKGFLAGELDPTLQETIQKNRGQVDLDSVFAAVLEGSPAAKAIIGEAGRFLGIGLANLVNLFDPEAVFIGGSMPTTQGYEAYLDAARHTMGEMILHKQRPLKVVISRFNERVRLVGATASVLVELLRSSVGEQVNLRQLVAAR